jgi:hypothetical protein
MERSWWDSTILALDRAASGVEGEEISIRDGVKKKGGKGTGKRSIILRPVEGSFKHVSGAFVGQKGGDGEGKREKSWFIGNDRWEV